VTINGDSWSYGELTTYNRAIGGEDYRAHRPQHADAFVAQRRATCVAQADTICLSDAGSFRGGGFRRAEAE
jgi:hypothetical protein